MPEKKNPDAVELLRGRAPRVVAHLAALHGVIHSLPLAYSKDLQEDKERLFDAVDTLELSLAAATGMIAGAHFDAARMREAASDELIAATDVADLLVKLGMPFREAHGVVAGLVRSVESGRSLSDLDSGELAAQTALLAEHEAEFRKVLESSSSLEFEGLRGGHLLAPARRAARAGSANAR